MVTRRDNDDGTEPGFDVAAVFVLDALWLLSVLEVSVWWVLQPKVQDNLEEPSCVWSTGKQLELWKNQDKAVH